MSDLTIETTTAGSLPRSAELVETTKTLKVAEDGFTLIQTDEYKEKAAAAVTALVKRRLDAGITRVGDGEYGKAMTASHDFGAWWSLFVPAHRRVGASPADAPMPEPVRSTPGHVEPHHHERPPRLGRLRRGLPGPVLGCPAWRAAVLAAHGVGHLVPWP
ncbi:hypothetical protein [Demequina litorisediminis]|uniref:Uncharacterized protein n=1 Tax=Demequina litorisediminis TaxID=1849022 RepID=A0ABQ6II04_9MICO|nr:hypothetical protein GCM10025876_37460 [Demequina litorisediminis]